MKGFSIRLSMKTMTLSGVAALDWRRARKLPDSARAYTDTTAIYFEVTDEAFIRAWFGPQETCPHAIIQHDWLKSGELIADPGGECVKLDPALLPARVQELFVRARFAALETELERVQMRLSAAEALLAKEDEVD